MAIGLESLAIEFGAAEVLRNAPTAILYEHAIVREKAAILSSGALATYSGEKTGRSPLDKRIVDNPESTSEIWWGNVNIPASDSSFLACRQQALDHLCSLELGLRRRRFCRVGPGIPDQGARRVRTGLSCALHAQPLDPAERCRSSKISASPTW